VDDDDLDSYRHEYWPDTQAFLDELDAGLRGLRWPPEIVRVSCERDKYQKLERARNYQNFEVSFSSGGLRNFTAQTWDCLKKFYSHMESEARSDLDYIQVEGNPAFILIRMTPLAIYNGIIKYLMFEQDMMSPQRRLGIQVEFAGDLSHLRDYHSLG
jgi:hypothetical protein